MQPEHHLPQACHARAPRFLASENEDADADVTPQVICPRPKPCPIQKQQIQTPLSVHDTSIQLPEDATVAGSPPQEHENNVGKEIALAGTGELHMQVLAHTGTPSQTLVLKDHPAATQGEGVQSGDAGAGPSTSVMGSELRFEPAEDENDGESELPVRCSRRLATREK